MRYTRTPSRVKITRATTDDCATPPNAWCSPTCSASQSALPLAPAIAAIAIPPIAPPAISPLENSTPGPDSMSARERLSERTRRSTSQRTIPPANIPADVVIGR